MTSTLKLYRRIGNLTAKEKRQPIEETTPSGKRYVCKIYPTEGKEFEAISVKPERNACGYGYRIVDRQGRTMFYKADEVAGIMPTREEIK